MQDDKLSRKQLLANLDELRRRVEMLEAENSSLRQHGGPLDKALTGQISRREDVHHEVQDDYWSVVQNASEAICIIQDGLLKFINPAGIELTGYSEEELLSMAFAALVHPEDLDELVRIYMMRLRAEYVPPGHRFRIITKETAVTWVESWSASIAWTGRPAVLSMIRDVNAKVEEEDRLRLVHDELDRRVQTRTKELQAITDRLTLEARERERAELSLRESEQMFRLLSEQSLMSIAVLQDGVYKYSNQAMSDLCEYSLEEILNWGPEEFLAVVHPDDRSLVRDQARMKQTGAAHQKTKYTFRIITKSGVNKWVEIYSKTVQFKGNPANLLTMLDITERKNAEERRRESENIYRSLVETSPDPIIMYDLQGNLITVNPQSAIAYGVESPEQLLAEVKHIYDILEDESREKAAKNIKQTLETGSSRKTEYTVTRKDGSTFPVEINTSMIRSAEDTPVGFISVVRDITERKRAEEELRKSRGIITSILNSVPQSIFWKDRNSVYLGCNEVFTRAVGLERPEQIVGKTDYDLPWPRDEADAYRSDDQDVMSANQPKRHIIEPLQQADGTRLWIDTTKVPLTAADGTVYGVLGVYDDITQRKKTEEAIRDIVEGVSGEIGDKFFESSVVHFAKILRADFTFIGEISQLEERAVVKTIAFSEHGELKDNFQYDLKGAPCEEVAKRGICSYAQGAAQLFPQDKGLQRWKIEAYVGTCLYDSQGAPTGIMAAMYLKPLENVEFAESVLRIFAARAAAEVERKRAEAFLRDSEERFRTAFQTSPDPIAISRLSDGVFVEVNDGFTELSGFTRGEVIGKSSLEINLWDDPTDRDRLVGQIKEEGHVTNLEAQFRQKDGGARAGLMSARTIALGGEPHILTVTRDVEDRKKAEQALRESEEKYRTLFEDSKDPVIITTRDGVVEDVNQAYLDLFGFTREEAQDMNILNLYLDNADRNRFRRDIEREGSVKDYPVKSRKKDGTEIECLLTSTVRRDRNGRIIGYQGIIRDVTDWNRLQGQLLQAQKMEAIGTLAGGIAHDFNNLLQVVLGYTDLLLTQKKAGDPDRQKLEIIQHGARDGADLVSRILTFSRRVEAKTRPVDLNVEIRRVEKLIERTVPKMIDIKLALADDLRIIDADPAQIEQLLLNLAVNAQHAMPDGGDFGIETSNVSLQDEYLRKLFGAKPGEYVRLTVSDTGKGMAPDVQDHIFEPFFTTKPNGEGTGLGLAMVHGIVSQHGGHIVCYSEPGIGTSFKIYFPVSKTERDWELAETPEMPAFGNETILLVDDDDRIREMGRQMVEMGGYRVLLARSGEEALDIYAAHKGDIALVILDLIMPGMGGEKCLDGLLRIDPKVKVIIASGYSSTGTGVGKRLEAAKGSIRKPYDAKDLLGAIRKRLDTDIV
jgi:PAS domain S-box-containing protein